jgi:hypothetical protein
MDERTYREALRTTARVTAVFTLVGCGGAIAPDPSERATRPSMGSYLGDAAPPPKPDARTPDARTPDASATDPAFLACNATLGARADGGLATVPGDLACCDVILTHIGKHWEDYSKVAPHVLYACCTLVGSDGGAQPVACTPWGPPMPPAMSFGAELVS